MKRGNGEMVGGCREEEIKEGCRGESYGSVCA